MTHNNFSIVLTLLKRCWVSYNSSSLHSFIYRCERETLENFQHIKESLLKLDQITNDMLLDLVNVLGGNNLKFIPRLEN